MAEPDVLPEVFERFLDHPVAPPPLDELRRNGAKAVRRRRRRGVAASCAAVLAIAGGALAVQTAFGPDDREPAPDPDVASPSPGPVDLTLIGGTYGLGDAVRYRDPVEMADDRDVVVAGVVTGFADGYEVLERGTPREGYDIRDYTVVMHVRVTELYKGSVDSSGYVHVSLSRGAAQEGVENDEGGPSTITPIEDFQRAIPVGSEVVVMASPVVLPGGAWTEIVEPRRGLPAGSHLLSAGHPQSLTFATPDGGTTAWRSRSMADLRTALHEQLTDGTRSDDVSFGGLQCDSALRSVGTIDVIPPATPQEAREQDWPTTAHDAAQAVIDAPFLARFGPLTLSEGAPADHGSVQFAAVDSGGHRVVILTVEELIRDAWAVTDELSCAGN